MMPSEGVEKPPVAVVDMAWLMLSKTFIPASQRQKAQAKVSRK